MKKKPIPLVIGAVLAAPMLVLAAHPAQLSTITVEGQTERLGTIALQPDTGGALDMASLLQRLPGANVNRNGPLTGLPQYRGLFGNRVNVMTDGTQLHEVGPNSMDTQMSYIPKALADNVILYRGIAPVSSGIETLGGTIVTESKRGQFSEGGGIETHGFGTGGFSWVSDGKYGAVNASVANSNHRAYFSGSAERGHNYRFKGDKAVKPSQYDRDTYSTGYGYQRNGHEFGINYDNRDTGKSGTPSLPMDIQYIRSDVGSINYNGDLGNGYSVEMRGFYQNARHIMDNFTLRPAPRPGGGAERFRQIRTTVEGGGYRLAFTIPNIASGNLKVGVDGDLANHNALVTDPVANLNFFIDNFNDVDSDRYAGFLEWNGTVAEKLSLEMGVRYIRKEMNAGDIGTSMASGHSPGMGAMTPQMSLAMQGIGSLVQRFNEADRSIDTNNVDGVFVTRYAVSNSLELELGFASKTRAPSYQERYLWIPLESTGGLADGRVYVGNPNLQSERSFDVEFGVDFHSDTGYFAPRAFYRYVDNYIQGVPSTDLATNAVATGMIQPGGPGALQFSNINAYLYGVDLEAGYVINDYFRLDGILNYVRGKRVGSVNDNLYRIAPLNARMGLTFEYSDLTLSTEWVGYTRQNKVSFFNGEKATPGYSLMNIRGQYQPSFQYFQGMTLAFGVNNVFDKEHAAHLNGINRAGGSDAPTGVKVPNPGRNIYVTASYQW